MKKFTLHLDVLIVVFILFVLCISGNIYQRKIHSDLHKQNISLITELTNEKLAFIEKKTLLNKCESDLEIIN
jgi:hypothetical protein